MNNQLSFRSFYHNMQYGVEEKYAMIKQARSFSNGLLRVATGDKWRYIPPQKDGSQFCKDTSNMNTSCRLVRCSVSIQCTEYELKKLFFHDSSSKFNQFMSSLLGKQHVDSMILQNILTPIDNLHEMYSLETLANIEKLNENFCKAENFLEEQIKENNPYNLNLVHLLALWRIAMDNEPNGIFQLDAIREQQIWEEFQVYQSRCNAEEAKIALLKELCCHVPNWCTKADDIFLPSSHTNMDEYISLKWGLVESKFAGSKRDFVLLDHFSEGYIEDKKKEKIYMWCTQSMESERVGFLSLKQTHGVQRGWIERFGFFWRKINETEMEIIACGSIKSKHAKVIMSAIHSSLHRIQEMMEDLRLCEYSFVSRKEWVSDNERNGCLLCLRNFSTWRRKHHCRMCGEVICSDCSMHRSIELPVVGFSKLRLCKGCISKTQQLPRKENNLGKKNESLRQSASIDVTHTFLDNIEKQNVASSTTDEWKNDDDNETNSMASNSASSENETANNYWTINDYDESNQKGNSPQHEISSSNQMFDLLCDLACQALNCPMASVCVTNDQFETFHSHKGLLDPMVQQELKLFTEKIMNDKPIVILDALCNVEIQKLLSSSTPTIRFFAGSPIKDKYNNRIGFLCVADCKPRPCLEKDLIYSMERLARLVLTKMEEKEVGKKERSTEIHKGKHSFGITSSARSRKGSDITKRSKKIEVTKETMSTLLMKAYNTQKQLEKTHSPIAQVSRPAFF